MKQESVSRLDTQSKEEPTDERNCCVRAMSCLADFCQCDRKLYLIDQPQKDVEDYENFNELRTERMRSWEKYPRDLRLDQESKEDLNRLKSCFTLQWWVDFLCCRSSQQLNLEEESVNSQKNLRVHEKTVEYYHNDKQPYVLDLKDSQVHSIKQDGIPKKKSDASKTKNLNILVRETQENEDIVNIQLDKNLSPNSQINSKKVHVKSWQGDKRSNSNNTPDTLITQKPKNQTVFDQHKIDISPIPSPSPVRQYKNQLNDFVFTDDATLENQAFQRNHSGIGQRKNGGKMKLMPEQNLKITPEPQQQKKNVFEPFEQKKLTYKPQSKQTQSLPAFQPFSEQYNAPTNKQQIDKFLPDDLQDQYQVNTRKNRLRGKREKKIEPGREPSYQPQTDQRKPVFDEEMRQDHREPRRNESPYEDYPQYNNEVKQSEPKQQFFEEDTSNQYKNPQTSQAFEPERRNQSQLVGNYQSVKVQKGSFEPKQQPIGRYEAQFNELNSFSNTSQPQDDQVRDMKKKKRKNIAAPRQEVENTDSLDKPYQQPSSNFQSSEPPSFGDIVPDIKKKKRNKFLRGDKPEQQPVQDITDIKKKKRGRVDLKHEYVEEIQLDGDNF